MRIATAGDAAKYYFFVQRPRCRPHELERGHGVRGEAGVYSFCVQLRAAVLRDAPSGFVRGLDAVAHGYAAAIGRT